MSKCNLERYEKWLIAKRIAAVTRRIIESRVVPGKIGSRVAEVHELAQELGCASTTVYRMMGASGGLSGNPKGARSYHAQSVFLPRLDILMRLCQMTKVSADWLLFGHTKPPKWWTPEHEEST